jgi:hypothetical protein
LIETPRLLTISFWKSLRPFREYATHSRRAARNRRTPRQPAQEPPLALGVKVTPTLGARLFQSIG